MIPHLTRSHSKDYTLKDRVQCVSIVVLIRLILLIHTTHAILQK